MPAAGQDVETTIMDVERNTEYTIYFVAEDDADPSSNVQTTVTSRRYVATPRWLVPSGMTLHEQCRALSRGASRSTLPAWLLTLASVLRPTLLACSVLTLDRSPPIFEVLQPELLPPSTFNIEVCTCTGLQLCDTCCSGCCAYMRSHWQATKYCITWASL